MQTETAHSAQRVLSSTWALGALAAIASWSLTFDSPKLGLDPSHQAGLAMATHRGMEFGSDVVFTFGPLGFLEKAWLWYDDLAVLGFVYSAALHIALCISVLWALRRTFGAATAFVLTILVVMPGGQGIELAIALTAVWCLVALSPEPPPFARPLVLFGGALLGAIQTLVLLRSGPIIFAMCVATLLALEHRRRDLPVFAACSGLALSALWLAAGQSFSGLPDYARNSIQIVSGYSEAMGHQRETILYVPVAALVGAALVAAAAWCSVPGRKRVATAAVAGAAVFVLFKEATVRQDLGHTLAFFATAPPLAAGIAFGRSRLPDRAIVAALVGLAAFAAAFANHAQVPLDSLSPLANAQQAVDQVRNLASPGRRERLRRNGRSKMVAHYQLEPSTLQLLKGHTVHVDPWEVGVAYAYGLDWKPLPVFQDYSAYTRALDRLNSDALRSPRGARRILRENPGPVDGFFRTPTIDDRVPAWDPPEAALAMLCNYVPLQTTARWQVLGKVPPRCRPPRRIGSTSGQSARIPRPPPGSVVFARIHGAAVSGLERVRTLLYRARFRYVVVNGGTSYRLVPGTAGDGLLMAASRGIDYPSPFALSPEARTIRVKGTSGGLRVVFYAMSVRPAH